MIYETLALTKHFSYYNASLNLSNILFTVIINKILNIKHI